MPNTLIQRIAALQELMGMIKPIPEEWLKGLKPGSNGHKGGPELELLPCTSYQVLINSWKKAMKWTDGLEHALSAMLASITSTMLLGDQLWIRVVSLPSTGKSCLCEALSTNKKYVKAVSTLRGFMTGEVDKEGGEDLSLLKQCIGKTLIIKDGDTLLRSPNLEQILSEARDIYDTTSRTSYRRKGASRDYEGARMTWLLCGTASLRALDQSELGERFLDCVIMEEIDDDLEDEVLLRVAHRSKRSLAFEANGDATTRQDPEMTLAMQLSGGYVEHLRKNAVTLLSQVDMSDDAIRMCTRFGKFVAFMRARPSKKQEEEHGREFAPRLVSQHTRLANCLAVVLNRKSVDEVVMERTRKIALDTSRGQTLELVKTLAHHRTLFLSKEEHDEGLEGTALAHMVSREDYNTKRMLTFLRKIGVVEHYLIDAPRANGLRKWRLTTKMRKLYGEVMGDA